MKNRCYLITALSRNDLVSLKKILRKEKNIYRITDHDTHLKVKSKKKLKPYYGYRYLLVEDKTNHIDERYWDFCMSIWNYALDKNQDPYIVIKIVFHYLCNLFDINNEEEAFLLKFMASSRLHINKTISNYDDHGWEIEALKGKKNG